MELLFLRRISRQNQDACQGDSGGPLVRVNPTTGRYEQVRINLLELYFSATKSKLNCQQTSSYPSNTTHQVANMHMHMICTWYAHTHPHLRLALFPGALAALVLSTQVSSDHWFHHNFPFLKHFRHHLRHLLCHAGVFVKLSHYLTWILKKTSKSTFCSPWFFQKVLFIRGNPTT